MIYLGLSILCSSIIFLTFKSFSKYKVHTYSAIVFNYMIAGAIGLSINGKVLSNPSILDSSWIPYSLVLGCVFIILFNIMAITTQKFGASVGSIANKMALVIPVIFAVIYYGDSLSVLKVIGIFLALAGILLSTLKPKTLDQKFHKSDLLFPLILFIGSGCIDTYVKYVEEFLLSSSADKQLFASATFTTAFLIGAIVMIINKKKRVISAKNLLAGTVLGTVNFGSIYFLLEAFGQSNLESSVIFPFNNVGVVLLTAQLSYFLFKERFSPMNLIGIALSVVSVVLIAMGI